MKKANINNHKEFKVPANYFDNLKDSILNENKQFGDKSVFNIPSNYFTELEDKILASTIQSKQNNKKKLWITISSIAACLLFFIIGFTQFSKSEEQSTLVIDYKVMPKVDEDLENDVYESLYKTYFVEDEIKKSPNEVLLDDLDEFYSNQQLSSNY